MRIEGGGPTFVPTVHPAALIYDPSLERSFLLGMYKAVRVAAGVPAEPEPKVIQMPKEPFTWDWFRKNPDWAFDLETNRPARGEPYRVLSWAVSNGKEALVWDKQIDDRQGGGNWKLFQTYFPEKGERVVQNGAFDLPILQEYGFEIPWTQVKDTMIAASILDPDDWINLGYLAAKYMDVYAWKHMRGGDTSLHYNALDAGYTWRLWPIFQAKFKETEQTTFFDTHIMPLLGKVIIPLNRTGVKLDRKLQLRLQGDHKSLVGTWQDRMSTHCQTLSKKLNVPFSSPIGPSGTPSPKKVQAILYDYLKLPVQYHPKTKKPSVDKSALNKLRGLDSTGTVELLLERSTYKELEVHIQVQPYADGRVRSRYVLGGDEKHREFTEKGSKRSRDRGPGTGRLASRQPNHQNIPKEARVIYIPTYPDWSLLEADSSQIELRLTQHFSGDPNLQMAIDKDAHLFVTWTVDEMTGLYGFDKMGFKTYEDLREARKQGNVLVEQARQECKRVSLGWTYRMGPKKLENTTGISLQRGAKVISALNAMFPGVVLWWDSLVSSVKQHGYLQNAFGRRRYFSVSEVPAICNFLSQGTAADILFAGQLRLTTELSKSPSLGRLIATVHDSNLLEGPDSTLPELASIVRSAMEAPIPELSGASFPVELKSGKNWRDLCPMK